MSQPMSRHIANILFFILSLSGHVLLFLVVASQTSPPAATNPRIQVSLLATEPLVEDRQDEINRGISQPSEPMQFKVPSDTEALANPIAVDNTDLVGPEASSGVRLFSRLQAQLPEVIEGLEPKESKPEPLTYQDRSNPKLPGGPSLFDQWMGSVSPSLDQWSEGSGAANARVTLASGDIICIKKRAPTTAELFNPWSSIAVPMSRICGKAKRDKVNLSDPWLSSRPKQ